MSSIGLRRSCHTLGATLLREPARKGRTGRPKNSPTHILSGSHVLCKYPNGYADVSSPRASIIAPRPAPVGWQAVEAPDSQNDELPSLRRERTRRPSLIDPDRFEDTVELFHAIVSPRYPQSFFNPQFAKLCDLSLHSLEPGEIRRFLTPRGWIRCTEAVILIYRLLGDPDADFKLCRTLVLPEDHPDPGVPLIIGLPWINEEPLLRQRIKNQTEYHAVDIRSSSSSQTTDLQGDVPADEIGPGARHSTLTGDAPSISTSSPLLAAPRLYEIAIISNKSQASSPNLGPQSDSGSRTSNEPRMWDVSSEDLSDTVSDLASESLDPHSPQEPTPGWSDASETAVENTPVCGEEDSDVEDSEDCMSDLTDDTNASTLDGHGFTTEVFTRLELPFVAWIEGKAMSLAQEKLEEAGLSTHSPMSQHSPGGETNTAGSSPSETAPQNSQRTSAPSPPGRLKLRKRKLDEKDDDDAGKRRGSWKGSADYTADTPIATFACPFHKKYPGNEKLGKACLGPGWESTHRVKEHIFRCHPRLALQCLRCFEVFDDDAMLRNHMRAQPPDQCNVIEEQELMHIRTTPQETELKKRSPRNMPEKEKWVRMYQILFPEVKSHEIPSPCES
ncbi:hypothetical protein B0T16DRAFT_419606 [Cercophora newfieldiana]|uniref:C2H2-type domain-containing protein n=1 Tax=Cercophora newfieldiana TaxID=92897 RepID=A0AA39XWA2_9PEZI|nr:hypothetical protein B0T16DRAFT_419606 [Cercophora newfieldiana]